MKNMNTQCPTVSRNVLATSLRAFALLVGAVAITALCGQAAQACPMCKEALSSNPNSGDVISGYFWSILFMMSMPFAIIGSFGLYAYLQVRKARLASEITDETQSF